MNICIVGAGSIGGWVAARLALAGETVMALTSRGPIDELELGEAGTRRTAKLKRLESPADVLVLATKATALAAAAQSARDMVGSNTLIIPMLNGVPWWFVAKMQLKSVDADGSIASAFPFQKIRGCVVQSPFIPFG